MDGQILAEAMGNQPGVDYDALAGPCNEAMIIADVTTALRAMLWCAQIGHESVGLAFFRELWGPTSDQLTYDGRLGNVNPGDGYRYRGRGAIQLTGRSNYRSFGEWAAQRGLTSDPALFENNPDLVAEPRWGFVAAAYYWVTRDLNRFAANREVTNSTHVINGGENGLADRINRYNRCFPLGDRLLPEQEREIMGAVADRVETQLVGPNGQGFEILGKAVETDPTRYRFLTEAVAVILEQLGGPTSENGESFGGWDQLGDGEGSAVAARTLVDGIAHVKNQNDQILAQQAEILKALKGGN
ncbi:hypothetical protein FND50_25015 [Rhodococcus sp. WB9]|uniref:glycoside hydrolase family 19 protein n=1 Tax=Rhodococcus sp. WB9 TaxID=2594007 RepID=UPI001186B663|nr:glycoside hydrolase family 19 protein [Rhodococcus sp. WB9]QDQ93693.1 hypothetical protein FND50_25015 [Rhodococcus sp. WB9]